MSMQAGDKLGPYEIVAPIGAGGMGKVYKLSTHVSTAPWQSKSPLKSSAGDSSGRLKRPPLSITPHCRLYDIGSLPWGASYIVTELERETLRDWLKQSLAPDQAQILEAPRAAHAADIIHRDLTVISK
jgi:serine/threonine protein kinase